MAVAAVRTADYLVTTAFADNTAGAIGANDAQEAAESAASIVLSPNGVKTANYTAVITDRGTVLPMNTASGSTAANATYTIPAFNASTFPCPNGATLGLLWVSGANVQPQFAAGVGVTVVAPSSRTPRVAGCIAWAWQYSQNVWYVMGDVT